MTDALVWLSAQMEDQYALKVAIQSNGIAGRFEDKLPILLFHAVRELLFNIVKHADTLQASIVMERVNEHLRITISDQGKGFDPQVALNASRGGRGLFNLQHRLNLVGCKLQIKSQPNVIGTQAILDIPLDK